MKKMNIYNTSDLPKSLQINLFEQVISNFISKGMDGNFKFNDIKPDDTEDRINLIKYKTLITDAKKLIKMINEDKSLLKLDTSEIMDML